MLDLSSQIPGWNLSASRFSSVIPNRSKGNPSPTSSASTCGLALTLTFGYHQLRLVESLFVTDSFSSTTPFIWPLTRGSHPETRAFSSKSSHPDTTPAKLESTSTSSVLLSNPSVAVDSFSLAAIHSLSTYPTSHKADRFPLARYHSPTRQILSTMTKSTALSLLLLSSLAVTAQGAATYNAQPGRHAPPYLASRLGNHKRSGWLDRVMGANPQAKAASSEPQPVESSSDAQGGQQHKRSAQGWDDRMMDAHPEVPSRPLGPHSAASGSNSHEGRQHARSAQSWDDRTMGAHPQMPSAPSAASSSSQSHGSHRRSPQSWLNRIMGSHPEQPSEVDSSAGVQELEYYGSSYGLVSLRALHDTPVRPRTDLTTFLESPSTVAAHRCYG